MKVLVVDDEFGVRETVQKMLSDVASEVKVAADAVSALLTLKDNRDIKAIITDYRMPGLSGMDWVELLKYYHPDVKLVVITGYEVARDKVIGKNKVLMKPFSREDLLAAIQ